MNKWLPYPQNKPEKGAYFVTVQWNNWRGTQTAFFNGKEWQLESPAVNTKVIAYMEAPNPMRAMRMKINEYPKTCNLCGGRVEYTQNSTVYGSKSYGSGYCYVCTHCGAYTGTHRPHPRRALGLLADKEMRQLKMQCHDLFDITWQTNQNKQINRGKCYAWLSLVLDIPKEECHFGWFDLPMLRRALKILQHQGFTQSAKLLLQQREKEALEMLNRVMEDVRR